MQQNLDLCRQRRPICGPPREQPLDRPRDGNGMERDASRASFLGDDSSENGHLGVEHRRLMRQARHERAERLAPQTTELGRVFLPKACRLSAGAAGIGRLDMRAKRWREGYAGVLVEANLPKLSVRPAS